MNTVTRTAIRVGNSIAVTLPQDFIEPGKMLSVTQFQDSIVIKPILTSDLKRTATNEEVAQKFADLEQRYGKLYEDLAHIQ